MPTLSTVVLARWAAPGLRVCNDYTELTRGSPHRRSDHGLWPGRASGLLSSHRAARRGAPPAPLQRRLRRAARRCLHFFVYPSFGHTRCLGSLLELAAAPDGALVDGAADCAAQSCTHSPAVALDGAAAGDATDRTDY